MLEEHQLPTLVHQAIEHGRIDEKENIGIELSNHLCEHVVCVCVCVWGGGGGGGGQLCTVVVQMMFVGDVAMSMSSSTL